MSRILVLAPHPDDESLGCGGTIAKHIADGDEVRVVYLCDCGPDRANEALKACGVLGNGTIGVWFLDQPDGAAKAVGDVIYRFEKMVETVDPDIIYAPHSNENHVDHRAAWSLATSIQRHRKVERSSTSSLRMYEIWTPLTDVSVVVDITPYLRVKADALECHQTQFHGDFTNHMDHGIFGLNLYRGAVDGKSQFEYGEAFAVFWP